MSASLGLYRLQVVDSRMDDIRSRLDEIRQILENDEEMQQARKRLELCEQRQKSALKSLKQSESTVEQQKIKIEQSEARLYSGTVKNPKELQDLQNEVAALNRHLRTLEDKQLEAMVAEESATESKNAALDELSIIQERLADQNKNLNAEQVDLNNELERFNSERQAALTPIDEDLMAIYNELRLQKKGLAVAVVSDGACAACGTTLTPAQNQNARSTSEIYKCPSCKRILFAN